MPPLYLPVERRASAPPRSAFVSLARASVSLLVRVRPRSLTMRDTGAAVPPPLMMREEASAIKRAELSATATAAAVRLLPTSRSSSSFFLPRYLRLPDICTRAVPRRRGEAEPTSERRQGNTLTRRAFCARENARRVCSSRRDSAARFTDSMKTYLSSVPSRLFPPYTYLHPPALSLSLLFFVYPLLVGSDGGCSVHKFARKELVNSVRGAANSAIKLNPILLAPRRPEAFLPTPPPPAPARAKGRGGRGCGESGGS